MCAPALIIPAITLAVSAASATLSAKAQADTSRKQKQAVRNNYEQQAATVAVQNKQTQAATTENVSERSRQALRDSAAVRVSSGEAGVGGLSVLSLLDNAQFNAGYDATRMDRNGANRIEQNQRQLEGIRSGAKSSLNNITPPDYIGAGLQIAGSAVDAYGQYKKETGTPLS
jgi:hypothetical protein